MYYRGAAAAIVVYDITNKESFNGAKSWVKELQRRGDPNVVIALAGNKADLQSKRKVNFEVDYSLRIMIFLSQEAQRYAEDNGILHMETSAKSSMNVKDLFNEIARMLPKQSQQTERETFPIIPYVDRPVYTYWWNIGQRKMKQKPAAEFTRKKKN